jgi:glycosyltransferase involved in cell wall biosynthesis
VIPVFGAVASARQMDEMRARRLKRATAAVHEKTQGLTAICVGRVCVEKAQHLLIQALGKLPRHLVTRVRIVGDGPTDYRQILNDLVQRLNLQEIVQFEGFTSDVFALFDDTDFSVSCSESEGFGLTTAESMASCVPVIGRDVPATNEVLGFGRRGLLFDGTVDSLAASIQQFAADVAGRPVMIQRAWEQARKFYTFEAERDGIVKALREHGCEVGE